MRDHSASSNGGLDEGIQFFVTTNGELKMPWRNTLDLQILTGVSGQLQDLGREVLEDGRSVNSCGGTDTVSMVNRVLQETVDTTNGELKSSLGGSRLGRLLGGRGLSTLSSLTAFSSFARLRSDEGMNRHVRVSAWWSCNDELFSVRNAPVQETIPTGVASVDKRIGQ